MAIETASESIKGTDLAPDEVNKVKALGAKLLEADTNKDETLDKNEIAALQGLDAALKKKLTSINLTDIVEQAQISVSAFMLTDRGRSMLSGLGLKSPITFDELKKLNDIQKSAFATKYPEFVVAAEAEKSDKSPTEFYTYIGNNKIQEIRKTIFYSLDGNLQGLLSQGNMMTGDGKRDESLGIDGKTPGFGLNPTDYPTGVDKSTHTTKLERNKNQKSMEIIPHISGLDFDKAHPTRVTIRIGSEAIEGKAYNSNGSNLIEFPDTNTFPSGVAYKDGKFTIDNNGDQDVSITMESGKAEDEKNISYMFNGARISKERYDSLPDSSKDKVNLIKRTRIDEASLSIETNAILVTPTLTLPGGFDSGGTAMSSALKGILSEKAPDIIQYLKLNPTAKLDITGYTDTDGDANANQLLSKARADVVANFLISLGVPKDRIDDVIGKGPNAEKPIKADNRRVEIEFTV